MLCTRLEVFRQFAGVRLRFVAAFVLALAALGRCVAQEPAPECQHREFLIDGLRDARMKLRSGVYEATGHLLKAPPGKMKTEGEVTVFCAFDDERGRMRFDRRQPQLFSDPETNRQYVQDVEYKFARTPERTLVWDRRSGVDDAGGFITVMPADFQVPGYAQPFNVRTFGAMGWSSIEGGATLELAYEQLSKFDVIESGPGRPGECKLVLRHGPNNGVETTYWINHAEGFTITRSEFRALYPKTNEWSDVMSLVEVEWTEEAGVWVPASAHFQRSFNGDEVLNLKFTWHSVNEPPPPELFEADGMKLPFNSSIVDRRLGDKPVVIGGVYDTPRPKVPLVKNESFNFWLVLINVGLIAILCLGYAVFRMRKRRHS